MPAILANPPAKGQIVLFLTGMNDVIRNGNDPTLLNAYLSNLQQALNLWEASGAEAYVGLPLKVTYNALMYFYLMGFPTSAYTPQLYTNSILALYNSSHFQHIHIVDTYDGYLPDDSPTGNSHDGIHPNDIGAQLIANLFLQEIL
jgi:lysophospholipase L1-like esterase